MIKIIYETISISCDYENLCLVKFWPCFVFFNIALSSCFFHLFPAKLYPDLPFHTHTTQFFIPVCFFHIVSLANTSETTWYFPSDMALLSTTAVFLPHTPLSTVYLSLTMYCAFAKSSGTSTSVHPPLCHTSPGTANLFSSCSLSSSFPLLCYISP